MKVKQTYSQRAFQMTLWGQYDMGYDIFPVMPVILHELTKSQQQFVNAKRERFELARTNRESYCILDHERCVMEFQQYSKFERIKVRWIDRPPHKTMSGWFIYAAWGSLEGVTYKITKWTMVFVLHMHHPARRDREVLHTA